MFHFIKVFKMCIRDRDTFGNTPLHYATIGQNINIVNRLVNAMKTSDIDARNEGICSNT